MKKNTSLLLVVAALLLTVATVMAAQTAQTSPQPKRSLGVSLSLPDGYFVGFPIQDGTPEENLVPIPIKGYKNLFGIRMYPHMIGDKVAVKIWAMIPKAELSTISEPLDPTKVPHEHRLLGDYVVGKQGDSIQIADFAKIGLPTLTAKVVLAPFSTESPEDPCCCTVDGLNCCGRTWLQMCTNCASVCPTCGALSVPTKLKTSDLSVSPAAKPEERSNKKH
ncbi:MAG TPA: hypothetical protein VI685_16795 [Candidatus Angelobacter sp.]